MSSVEGDDPDDDLAHLFANQFQVYAREFKGQSSGQLLATWQISSNSVDEFKTLLWLKVKEHIKCEIIVSNEGNQETYAWATDEPNADDINR